MTKYDEHKHQPLRVGVLFRPLFFLKRMPLIVVVTPHLIDGGRVLAEEFPQALRGSYVDLAGDECIDSQYPEGLFRSRLASAVL